jgi:site-specific DNA recombinase
MPKAVKPPGKPPDQREAIPWDICVRISRARRQSDGKMETFGVDRQEPPCREWVESHGGYVAKVHVANDVSGYSGDFPFADAYDRLRSGQTAGLVAWHQDRFTRQVEDWTGLAAMAAKVGGRIHTLQGGEIEVRTPGGDLMGNIFAAVGQFESKLKAERLRLKHQQLAQTGRPKGGPRPFGFNADGIGHRKAEARLLREAKRRVLGGDSLRSIVQDWDGRGVRTATGARWQTSTLKRSLLSPRVAGLREYHGAVLLGDDGQPVRAAWEPIIDPDDQDRLRRELDGRKTPSGPGGQVRTYLLGGFAVCGYDDCGLPLTTGIQIGRNGHRYRSYICKRDPARDGCGRITRHADHLEAYVTEVALELLDTPEVTKAIKRAGADDGQEARLQDERDAILGRLRGFEDYLGDGTWNPQQYGRQVARKKKRLDEVDAELARLQPRRRSLVAIPYGQTPAWAWHAGSIDVKRSLLASVIERVIVHPGRPGRARFRRDLIDIIPVPDIADLEVVQRIVQVTRAATT